MNPEETNLNPVNEQKPTVEPRSGYSSRQRELTSEELLCGQQEVVIRHGDEIYRLRVTRNGKLILHK